MRFQSSDTAGIAWGVAGIPLVATFVQTVLALLDTTSNAAGLAPVVDPLLSVELLQNAAVVFKTNSAVVLLLFVLLTVGWVVQGLSLFVWRARDVCFAAAGLVSVVYLALFFGVYSSLLGQGYPTLHLVGFFTIPVAATGGVATAAVSADWSADVQDRLGGEIGDLSGTVAETRSAFRSGFETRFGDLARFESVAPEAVERLRRDRAEFEDACDRLDDRIQDLSTVEDVDVLRTETAEVRERIRDLDASSTLDEMEDRFRQRLVTSIRSGAGELSVRSRYGESYGLTNLPTKYREPSLGPLGRVHIDHLDESLVDAVESGTDLDDVARAMEQFGDHRELVRTYVENREREVASSIETAEAALTEVDSQLSNVHGGVRGRLEELTVEGRHDDLLGRTEVTELLTRARESLHQCRFEDAEHEATRAADAATELLQTVEFCRTLLSRIDYGNERITVPSGIEPGVVTSLAPVLDREYGVDVEVDRDEGVVRVDYPGEDAAGEETDDGDRTLDSTDSETKRIQSTLSDELDGVMFVLREMRDTVDESEGRYVQVSTAQLPGAVDRETLLQLERFAKSHSDLTDEVTVSEDDSPSFLEFAPREDVTPARAIDELQERLRQRKN